MVGKYPLFNNNYQVENLSRSTNEHKILIDIMVRHKSADCK